MYFSSRIGLLLGGFLLFLIRNATAQPAYVVRNISTAELTNLDYASSPRQWGQVGEIAYFAAPDEFGRDALWQTDGSPQGTMARFRVSNEEAVYRQIEAIAPTSNQVYFTSTRADGGVALWVLDASPAGAHLVTDFATEGFPFKISEFVAVGSELYFVSVSAFFLEDRRLWRTTGPDTPPIQLRPEGSETSGLVAAGGKVYFSDWSEVGGRELWVSDGTPEGTRLAADFVPGSGSSDPAVLRETGGNLYVQTRTETGWELWRLPLAGGAPERLLSTTSRPIGRRTPAWEIGGRLMFISWNEQGGQSLYATDGTPGGTTWFPVTLFGPSAAAVLGNAAIIAGEGALLRTDGTPEGTFRMETEWIYSEADWNKLFVVGNRFFFRTASGIFASDGTSPAVERVVPDATAAYVLLGGVGTGMFARRGAGLWRLDSSNGSLTLVRQFGNQSSGGTQFSLLLAAGENLIYGFRRPDDNQVWGTRPGAGSGSLLIQAPLVEFLGTTQPGSAWLAASRPGRVDFYKTDGTVAGTVQATSLLVPSTQSPPMVYGIANGTLLHVAVVSAAEFQIWTLDTVTLGLTYARSFPWDSFYYQGQVPWRQAGGLAYFQVRSGWDQGLWRTDGTPAGTLRIFARNGDTSISVLPKAAGDVPVFVVQRHNGVEAEYELWRTDGTPGGTGPFFSFGRSWSSEPSTLLALDGRVYFLVASVETGFAHRLYSSDGTAGGTREVIPGFDLPSTPLHAIFRLAGKLAFFLGTGTEKLFITDGVASTTRELWSGSPGDPSSFYQAPYHVLTPQGLIFTAVSFPAVSRRLMISDGTPSGTRVLLELPSSFSEWDRAPHSRMTLVGSTVYYAGTSPVFGYELMALPLTCVGAEPGAAPVIEREGDGSGACGEMGKTRLRVTGPYSSYLWSTGETSREVTVSPASTDLVSVIGLDPNGCVSAPAYEVVPVRAIPSASVEGGSRTICSDESASLKVYLTGDAPWQILWSDGFLQDVVSSPATRTVSQSFSRTYSVVDVKDRGCFGKGSGSTTVYAKAPVLLTAPAGVCANGTGYEASNVEFYDRADYAWSIENGVIEGSATSPSVTFTAGSAGPLKLRLAMTYRGCTSVAEKTIDVFDPPAAPVLSSPADGTLNVTEPVLTWSDSGQGPFDVLLDAVSPPRTRVAIDLRSGQHAVSGWLPGQTYYWRIARQSPCGPIYSEIRKLVTGTCPWTGEAPVPVSPPDGATGQAKDTPFVWSEVPGTGHYDLYLGSDPLSLKRYRTFPAGTTSTSLPLNPGSWFFWKITAVPSCGNASAVSSSVAAFQTAASSTALSFATPSDLNRQTSARVAIAGAGLGPASQIQAEAEDGPLSGLLRGAKDAERADVWIRASQDQRAGWYDVWLEEYGSDQARLPMALTLRAFTDVPPESYAFLSTDRTSKHGFLKLAPAPGAEFLPARVVTRAEAAMSLAATYRYLSSGSTVLEQAACTSNGYGSTDFIDLSCRHEAWLSAHWLKVWGITQGAGCPEGPCFLPDRPLDRAQMVTFLLRMKFGTQLAGLLESFGAADPGCTSPWPSCTGWTEDSMNVGYWPRREANLGFQTRLTTGCHGLASTGMGFCPWDSITRDQLAEFLARLSGLVPSP